MATTPKTTNETEPVTPPPAEPVTPTEPLVAPEEEAPETEPVPASPVVPAEPVAPENRATFSVMVNGAATSDMNAIQSHINVLEGFYNEQRATAREQFVNELIEKGQIAAPQGESMKNLVALKNMSDDQFAMFRQTYENAPQLPLLARHGVQVSNGGGDAEKVRADRIALLQEIVNRHRMGGMKEDVLQTKDSFIELQALLAQQAGQGS